MKKLVLTVVSILTCGSIYALPVGNPSEASLFLNGAWWESTCCEPCDPCFSWCDAWSIRIGFVGDYVFNRHMELKKGAHADIDTTQIFTNAGFLALNFCDRVDIFGKLGDSKLHIRTDARSWGSNVSLESELNFETYFSWGAGARATLWECNCFAIGIEGEYFQTNPDVNYFLNYNDGTLTYLNDADSHYSEWQVGLGISYRFATCYPTLAMVPYAAIKWSWSKLVLDDFRFSDFTLGDLESEKLWGYAIGLSFTLCDMIGVTVEGRFADEKALYVTGQARF